MGRIRTIKPEFWANEKMAKVSRDARLLALALLNIAEDHGVARANPAYLRGQAFPYDEDLSTQRVGELVIELEGVDYLRRFGFDGQAYLFIVGFPKHQKIDRPSKPTLPQPPENTLDEPSTNTRRALDEPSRQIAAGREGKGREGKGREEEAIPPPSVVLDYQEPKKPPEAWNGEDFHSWAQAQRIRSGLLGEKLPNHAKLNSWWSQAYAAVSGDVARLQEAFFRFGEDKHWEKANPPHPWAAFQSQCLTKYVPQEAA